jgi:hypothetical protein
MNLPERFSVKGEARSFFVNSATVLITGRQPPPLSSVLYGIIFERPSVLAAQLLLREKSGA